MEKGGNLINSNLWVLRLTFVHMNDSSGRVRLKERRNRERQGRWNEADRFTREDVWRKRADAKKQCDIRQIFYPTEKKGDFITIMVLLHGQV
jgi:hypothetical protein